MRRRGLGVALWMALLQPAWAATPAPSAPPAVVVTPPPAFIPGPGINRPDWQELGPNEQAGAPSNPPGGLPHYIGLPGPAREAAERLRDLVGLLDGHLRTGRLASARIALVRAEAHVKTVEEEHLVLKVHPDWSGPREALLDLRARYEAARRGPVDAESQRLAEVAEARVARDIEKLAQGFALLDFNKAHERLAVMRRVLNDAESDPWLIENPAWRVVRQPVLKRVNNLEKALALRVGASRLSEALARIDTLRLSADAAIVQGSVSSALGDLEALEEACAGFEHELAELLANGYDIRQLAWVAPGGELRGRDVQARVKQWRAEGVARYKQLSETPQ